MGRAGAGSTAPRITRTPGFYEPPYEVGRNLLGFPSQRGDILLRKRSSPMGEARRKFDKDFREGAVRLVRETGTSIRARARPMRRSGRPPRSRA
jgi:hypothetical protein